MLPSLRRLASAARIIALAGAVLFVTEWTSLRHRIESWPSEKAAVFGLLDDVRAYDRERLDAKEQVYLDEDVERIRKTCLEVERRHVANLAVMDAAIGEKMVAGGLDERTARELLEKAEGLHAARMYYLYGAFAREAALEILRGEPARDKAALADKLAIKITRAELDDVAARFKFRPREYGLPTLPDIDVDGDRLVPSSRPSR